MLLQEHGALRFWLKPFAWRETELCLFARHDSSTRVEDHQIRGRFWQDLQVRGPQNRLFADNVVLSDFDPLAPTGQFAAKCQSR